MLSTILWVLFTIFLWVVAGLGYMLANLGKKSFCTREHRWEIILVGPSVAAIMIFMQFFNRKPKA
jgi:hypothetical protein